MDAANLRVFEAVARLGNMSRAAQELNTVQSNVTARIRALEHELGVPLFHRTNRGVALTEAGQRLLPYAAQIGRLLADARRAVDDNGTPRGPLTIGSLESTAGIRLPRLLAAYAAAHPEVDLVLTPGDTSELIDRTLNHEVDGAFVCGPVNHPDLDEEVIFREELVIVTAQSAQSLADLLGQRHLKIVILKLGCSYRQRLEDVLARRGVVGLRRLEFGTIDGILGAVAAGVGITLLPRSLVAARVRAGEVAAHALPDNESQVDTVFIRPR
ncbi:MAG: LysR family transcriptional regulator, partial [Bradyrhizobiaceae bacterium]|nr:LysR family transcriptional regulator [Bradyrhizobiaceae bacterium]